MSEDRENLVAAWIASQNAETDSPEHEKHFWAYEGLDEMIHDDPEAAWRIILAICERDKSDHIVGAVSAGPLEDLLALHGPKFIDRVEARAASDPSFRDLLGGVWRNAMTKDIWKRVRKSRSRAW